MRHMSHLRCTKSNSGAIHAEPYSNPNIEKSFTCASRFRKEKCPSLFSLAVQPGSLLFVLALDMVQWSSSRPHALLRRGNLLWSRILGLLFFRKWNAQSHCFLNIWTFENGALLEGSTLAIQCQKCCTISPEKHNRQLSDNIYKIQLSLCVLNIIASSVVQMPFPYNPPFQMRKTMRAFSIGFEGQ